MEKDIKSYYNLFHLFKKVAERLQMSNRDKEDILNSKLIWWK